MTYLGFDVMPINPNRVGSVREVLNRKVAILDSRTGKRWSDEESPAPALLAPERAAAVHRKERPPADPAHPDQRVILPVCNVQVVHFKLITRGPIRDARRSGGSRFRWSP